MILSKQTFQQLESALQAAVNECKQQKQRVQAYTLQQRLEAVQQMLKQFKKLMQPPAQQQEQPIEKKEPAPVQQPAEENETARSAIIAQQEILTRQPPKRKRKAPRKPRK